MGSQRVEAVVRRFGFYRSAQKKRSLLWVLKIQKGDRTFHSGGEISSVLYSFGRNT